MSCSSRHVNANIYISNDLKEMNARIARIGHRDGIIPKYVLHRLRKMVEMFTSISSNKNIFAILTMLVHKNEQTLTGSPGGACYYSGNWQLILGHRGHVDTMSMENVQTFRYGIITVQDFQQSQDNLVHQQHLCHRAVLTKRLGGRLRHEMKPFMSSTMPTI